MKTTTKGRAFLFLCAISLIFASLINVTAYAQTSDASSSDIYYCREALKSLPNSEALIYAYDSIVSGVENSVESVSVYDGTHTISVDEIKIVLDAYTRDHTEQFWLEKNYSVLSQLNTVKNIKLNYMLSGEELNAARVAFDNAVKELLSYINDGMSEYEKELALHDALAARVVYVETEHAHDAYGALVEGKAVCEGYAEALQCLLHAAKIQSLIATGSSINPTTNAQEGHAWNIVRIDGRYYHTDLTWNDQGSTLYHAYFNITDTTVKEDHTVDDAAFPLPVCISYESNYFVKTEKVISEYSIDSISNLLIQNSLLTSVYISGDSGEFIEWFGNNIEEIAGKIGISGAFSYGYQKLGREVILNIEYCLHDSLTFVPASAVSCTEDGNEAHYVCTCGRYFRDIEAKNDVLSPETLFFSAYGHNFKESPETDEFLRSSPETCLTTYTYWHSCTRCGEISNKEYSKNDIRGPHSPGAPATTDSPEVCTLCNEILAPPIHTHTTVLVPEKVPTCTENGKKSYYTCECGKSFIDADATKQLINPDNYGNIDALGHGDIKDNGRCARCGELLEVFNRLTVSVGIGIIAFFAVLKILSLVFRILRKKK